MLLQNSWKSSLQSRRKPRKPSTCCPSDWKARLLLKQQGKFSQSLNQFPILESNIALIVGKVYSKQSTVAWSTSRWHVWSANGHLHHVIAPRTVFVKNLSGKRTPGSRTRYMMITISMCGIWPREATRVYCGSKSVILVFFILGSLLLRTDVLKISLAEERNVCSGNLWIQIWPDEEYRVLFKMRQLKKNQFRQTWEDEVFHTLLKTPVFGRKWWRLIWIDEVYHIQLKM